MHCILTTTKEFKELLTQTKLDERTLKAAIAVWQEDNGVDNYPSSSDISNLIPSETKITTSQPISKLEETLQRWFNVAGVQYNPVEDLEVNGKKVIARADILKGILEVVEGRRDASTLAEEAAHFLVEMLPENHPVLLTMMNSVSGTKMYQKVVDEYGAIYNYDSIRLRKEAVGKLIAQEVLNKIQETKESDTTSSKFTKFFNAILNWIKTKFKFLSSNTVYQELEAYKTAAELILSPENTQELIDSGGLKKYGESNWNSKVSDYLYQVSSTAEERATTITSNLDVKRAKMVNGIYQTPEGKILNRRVTDYVKDFYAKIFESKDLTTEEATYRKLKGTYIHKISQVFINNSLRGLPTDEGYVTRQAQSELLKEDAEFVEAYRQIGNELWSLGTTGYSSIKKGLTGLLSQIVKNNNEINALTGLNKPFSLYSEVAIYDEKEDTAGTIDLLVVYPNGVVGIYDFKSMNFGFSKDVSSTKIEAFQIQLDWYKKILVQNYGVKDFKESRIIPIDVKLTKDNKVYSISMTEDYLQPIPIKELTGNKKFDEELEKLYAYADLLRKKLRKNYKDDATKVRLFRVEKSIRSMLMDKELKFLDAELQDMAKELSLRSSIDSESKEGKVITDEDINEMLEFVIAIKGTVSRFNETLNKDATEEQKKSAEIITGKVIQLENNLRDKVKELINKVNPNEDVDTPHKQLGFFSRIFNPTFDIDSPVIRKVQKLIQDMSFSIVTEVNELVQDIEVKMGNLKTWANAKGMSLIDAYKLMINENTGDLVTRLSSQYYQDRKEAIKKGGVDKESWIKKYHTFDKEAFDKKRAERVALLEKQYPGTTPYKVKLRESALDKFDRKYNVNRYDSAINESNWYLKINESALPKNYFNEKWTFIQAKGNEALKEYYDSYIRYNEKFAAITGRDINRNFVAEIRKDALSRAASNGIGSLFNVKGMFLEMLEVRQEDALMGSIDPITGEVIPNIPLLYTDDLKSRLSSSELKKLEAEATAKYKKGSREYIDYLSTIVNRAERVKGLETKSYDLTRSLVLFAKSAYTYKHLAESEAYVKNLKYYIETGGGKSNLTDGADSPMYNKYTNKLMTISGVPTSELELLDNIIQGVWYGRSVLDKDRIFNEKSITDSEGNIIGRTTGFSRNKSIRNLMNYISIRALGLNPFSAVGNFIGTRSNLLMLGSEGNIIDNKSIMSASKRAYKDRKRYMAAAEILQPYAHNKANEIANNLSATRLEKLLTMDNAFILMKHPDEQVDRIVSNAMLEKYGISESGKIVHVRKLPEGSKTLLDMLVEDSNGNWKFDGVSNEELAKFRVAIYKMANKIKGSVPDEMKASFSRTLTGKVLMHFRGWMPGLISTRFKDTSYDPDLDELDAGRFRVAWGEIFNSGSFLAGMKEFGMLLSEATITGYFNGGLKKINMNATKIAYDKFRLSNPEQADNLTLEDFVELRKAKLRGMATELRAYLLMAMLMLLTKSLIPDDDEESLERFMSRNAYMMANRGFLELSFFLQPSSVKQILKSPIPAMQMLWDTELLLRNTVDEFIDLISGRKDTRDKTPFTYYTVTRFSPFGKTAADIFDVYGAFQTK